MTTALSVPRSENEKIEILKKVGTLLGAWGRTSSDAILRGYALAISKFSFDEIMHGIDEIVMNASDRDQPPSGPQLAAMLWQRRRANWERERQAGKFTEMKASVTPWTEEQKAEARRMMADLAAKLSAQEQLDPQRAKEWEERQ